ncbi:MAG TPA: Trp biosynthesis-associated membrane protein, partial [Actinotalea sp.]|nr:Trp biosynthesis-associated membrane protein [Actinotalea sp.]
MTRRQAVLALVLAAVAVLATTVPVWLRGTTANPLGGAVALTATGAAAAPGVAAGGVVVLAAALALALGRRWGTRVATVVAGLAGVLVAVSAAGAGSRAGAVLGAAAADLTGVTEVSGVVTTGWQWVALVAGVVAGAVAVAAGLAAGQWHDPSARHDAPGARQSADRPQRTVAGTVPDGPLGPPPGPGSPSPPPGTHHGPDEVWDPLT